jgi:hypothetical protein
MTYTLLGVDDRRAPQILTPDYLIFLVGQNPCGSAMKAIGRSGALRS